MRIDGAQPVKRQPEPDKGKPSHHLQQPSDQIKANLPVPRQNPPLSGFQKVVNWIAIVIGVKGPDNSPYADFSNQTIELSGISDENERHNAILKNVGRITDEKTVVISGVTKSGAGFTYEHGIAQTKNDEASWKGISQFAVPMSSELLFLAGDTSEQHYYHDCFVYNIANAIRSGKTLFCIEDIDGTNTDKRQISFATRIVQPLRQIHANTQAINSAHEELGMNMLINTARSINTTAILARNQGMNSSKAIVEHYGPAEEFAGLSLSEKLKFYERFSVASLNGTIVHRPNEPTAISNKLMRANQLFETYLKEFIQESFTDYVEKNQCMAAEPKGSAKYLLETQMLAGYAYQPHYTKICWYKEKFVDNREPGISDEKAWQNFADAVKAEVDAGKDEYRKVNKTLSILQALQLQQSSTQDASTIHILQTNIEQATSQFNEDFAAACKHIKLIGVLGNEEGFNNAPPGQNYGVNDEFNYYRILQEDPQYFFWKVTQGAISALCKHNYTPMGTPLKDAPEHGRRQLNVATDNLRIRDKIRHLNSTSSTPLKPLHEHIQQFVAKGKKILQEEGAIAYLNYRLLRHMMHHFTKDKLSQSLIFDCNDDRELRFSQGFISEWEDRKNDAGWISFIKDKHSPSEDKTIEEYMIWLGYKLRDAKGITQGLVEYTDHLLPSDFIRGITKQLEENCFYPDEVYIRNGKEAYTGRYLFTAVLTHEDKTSSLKPDYDYDEWQPCKAKLVVCPSFTEAKRKNLFIISSGDTLSDTGTHVSALERGGIARIIYGLILDEDLYDEGITQREKYWLDIANASSKGVKQNALNELEIANKNFGTYGLKKVTGGYQKIVVDNGEIGALDNGKVFTREEILKEIKIHYAGRIDRTRSPAAKIRRFAEAISHVTGVDIEFNEEDAKTAIRLYNDDPNGKKLALLTAKARKIYNAYSWYVAEEKYGSLLCPDTPRFRVFYEYYDPISDTAYYRKKSDGRLATPLGKLFTGDETKLEKRPIKRVEGGFVYEQTGQPFTSIKLLNRVLCEEELLPSASPVSGLFAKEWLLKFLGKGNIDNGRKILKDLVTKLPEYYNHMLEISGALVGIGGLLRLGSKLVGGTGSTIYQFGYWVSNSMRAVAALAGSLRGLLNPTKYYDIFAGEVVNIISALFLPNGPKHLGLGIGNLLLFTGRGRQRAQVDQRINNFTRGEINNEKLLQKVVDPRPFVRDATTFSSEKLIRKVKNATLEHNVSSVLGEMGGNLVSAVLTPIKMIGDVIQDHRLITQWKERRAESSGIYRKQIPSAGHLLTLVGALSGFSAVVAGTLGRLGTKAESGFNSLGNFAISFANAIPALGIIANGFEVAANPLGLPRLSRGLDGKDMYYNPQRAGYGQVLAGILYAILPWFGLHNEGAAAAFDVATATYFGAPGVHASVAEEEKLNTTAVARNILIEGGQFYRELDDPIVLPKEKYKNKPLRKTA